MKNKRWMSWVGLLGILLIFSVCAGTNEADLVEKARIIHDEALTVDTHCDTPMMLVRGEYDMGERHEPGRRAGKIDLPRMKEGGLDAEFFAAFVGQGRLDPEGYASARERADRMIDAVEEMCRRYPELVEKAVTPEDAVRLEKAGKRAAFIGMENGYPIGRDLSLVKYFYDRGVRYITLCHGGDNDICDSATERKNPEDNGLSEFGRTVVEECNRLGMMVDLSHLSDRSIYDVLELSKAPVFASHSSVRALCDHPRNLTDDMLNKLKDNRGVIQICLVSSFVKTPVPNPDREKALNDLRERYSASANSEDEGVRDQMRREYSEILEKYPMERASVKDLVDHIDHVVRLIGVDHVGIGTDFDGGGGIEGCDHVGEMPNITLELLRRGYSQEDIAKIWGGNVMRVMREVIETARGITS